MATIKDIAEAAGVSHGTVSNVLNKRGNVSYAKIKLVEEIASQMGYVINEKASSLREGKTKILAVILPNISEAKYADLYSGINAFAEENNYKVRLFLTNEMLYIERAALKKIISLRAEWLLAVTSLNPDLSLYGDLEKNNISTIFLERSSNLPNSCSLSFDFADIARNFAKYIKLKRFSDPEIAVITESSDIPEQKIYCQALKEELNISESNIYENKQGNLSSACYEIFNSPINYKAIIKSSEFLADKIRDIYVATKNIPEIYTISSLRPCQNPYYNCACLNYCKLGYVAASKITGGSLLSSNVNYLESSYYNYMQSATIVQHESTKLQLIAHSTPGVRALGHLLPKFKQKYNIDVEINLLSAKDIRKYIIEKNAWDICRVDPSEFSYLAPKYFACLTEIEACCSKRFADYIDLPEAYYNVSGSIYGLPFDIAVQMLFFQSDLFADMREQRAFLETTGHPLQIPKNFSEFTEICRFFSHKERAHSPVKFGTTLSPKQESSITTYFLPRLLSDCNLNYDARGLLNLQNTDVLKCLKDFIAFDAYSGNESVQNWSEITENFMQGQTATTIVFSNHASNFIRKAQSKINLEIAAATIPGAKPLLGGGSLAINRFSSNKAAAYKFIDWACSPSIASELVELGSSSACKIVYEQREILDCYPWLIYMRNNFKLGIRPTIACKKPQMISEADFETILGSHLMRVKKLQETPEEALKLTQLDLQDLYLKSFNRQ